MNRPEPPLTRELDGVHVHYTWKFGERRVGAVPAELADPARPAHPTEEAGDGGGGSEGEVERLRAQVRQLSGALEDIVAFALGNADYKERAIMMHRRAVAALSGLAVEPGGEGRR